MPLPRQRPLQSRRPMLPPGAHDESSPGHGGHGAHGGPMPPGARDESSPSHSGHGRRCDHGGHGARDADPDDHGGHGSHGGAVPAERATRRRRVTTDGGHGGHCVGRRPSGWAIPSVGGPAEAGQRRTTISPQGGRAGKIKKCRRHLNGRASRRHLNGRNDGAARMNLASSEKERTEEACNGWASGEVPAVTLLCGTILKNAYK